jgi:hypothetical protein
MALDFLCSTSGINGGTVDCPITPGVGKYLVGWGGKLTAAQLAAGYTICKNSLIADSKKSKNSGSKLVVFPIIAEFTSKKEANVEAKMADGFSEVRREGLPAYELKIRTDMYQSQQLRKINNKRRRWVIVDDKNLFIGTRDADGNMIGKTGKIFVNGIDAGGLNENSGECMITVNLENAGETFDSGVVIQLDKAPTQLFKYLKDIQLYEKSAAALTGGTAPTRTVTITAIGATNDTINIPYGTISGQCCHQQLCKQ